MLGSRHPGCVASSFAATGYELPYPDGLKQKNIACRCGGDAQNRVGQWTHEINRRATPDASRSADDPGTPDRAAGDVHASHESRSGYHIGDVMGVFGVSGQEEHRRP
jgi:hypothetical protein